MPCHIPTFAPRVSAMRPLSFRRGRMLLCKGHDLRAFAVRFALICDNFLSGVFFFSKVMWLGGGSVGIGT